MSGETLPGQNAFNLYQRGKQKWNNWVNQNPDAVIDFSNFDFKGRIPDGQTISFERFIFPNGGVHFDGAQFGDGDVRFDGAQFGDGDVGFVGARFGDGDVRFNDAQFGKGCVSFDSAEFGKGHVRFHSAQFGDGVSFACAHFGDGDVGFVGAQFGKGCVSFDSAEFGEGHVLFDNVQFGEGNVSFACAHFGDGNVIFRGVRFGDGEIDFSRTQFNGSLYFEATKNTEDMSSWSFNGAVFRQNFVIEGRFRCIPDLRHTKIEHHLDLSNVKIDEDLKIDKLIEDKEDAKEKAACLRRLRELAENNRHHDAGLDFFALESRVMRKSGHWGRLRSALDCLYEWASNYGRSILRPSVRLFWLTVAFTFIYCWAATGEPAGCDAIWDAIWDAKWDAKWQDALNLALSNALPFILSSRGQAEDVFQVLFPEKTVCLVVLTYLQSLFSLVFIFLIGLGLRNRFRL